MSLQQFPFSFSSHRPPSPNYSVSPLLMPRQQLLLCKSSPHHCLLLLDVPCPDKKTLFLRCWSRLPRGHKSLLRKSTCSVAEVPDVPTKSPQVATSDVCPIPVFSTASRRFLVVRLLALATLNCHLVPQFPLWIGRPCGMDLAPLCGTRPCSCELALAYLVPLYQIKLLYLLFITVLRGSSCDN